MSQRWLHYLLVFLSGILGMAVFLMLWHLYLDHALVDFLRGQLQQQQQQQQVAPAPEKK